MINNHQLNGVFRKAGKRQIKTASTINIDILKVIQMIHLPVSPDSFPQL